MQRTLGERGVVRSPAEAPREYLQRALVASRATEREARTLTGLFEEARYSAHPIPERLRELAVVRVALAPASAAGGRSGVRLLAEIGLVVLAGIAVAACVSLLPDARPTRRRPRRRPRRRGPISWSRSSGW